MANWWEQGSLRPSEMPAGHVGEPMGDIQRPSPWGERLRGTDWGTIVIIGMLALLVLALRGFDLWRGHELESEQLRIGLRQAITDELVARRESDRKSYHELLDPQADREQMVALMGLPLPPISEEPPVIEHWQFNGPHAMVDLRFPGPPATRETRFYHYVDNRWLRTAPVASFWGGRLEADAPGIHLIYRAADATVARDVIEAIDTAFRQGNMTSFAGKRLTVEIVPAYRIEYDSRSNRLSLPSPRLAPRPVGTADGAMLLWLLAHPVADRLADPGDAARYRYLDTLQLLRDHLRYWSMRRLAPFPNRWQVRMIDTLRTARDEEQLVVPRAIDLFSANRMQAHLAYYEVMSMTDYIYETYGSNGLLSLEQVLGQVPSWDRAVPAALGVSIGDLERGWRDYLQRLLGPSTRPTPVPGTSPTPMPEATPTATS